MCDYCRHIIRKVEVVPGQRIAQLRESEFTRASEVRGLGPCHGFSTQYACMCDYHTMPYREEVAWVSILLEVHFILHYLYNVPKYLTNILFLLNDYFGNVCIKLNVYFSTFSDHSF